MARAKRTDNKGIVLRVGEQQRAEDGRYLYRYTDLHGKKKTIYATTLPELRKKEEGVQRDLQDGIETSDITLNELFEIFMESKKNLRPTTRNNYLSRWNNAFESTIGKMKIDKIKQLHITSLITEFEKDGAAEGTIRTNINLLSSVFEMAVESDLIRKNPCKGCGKYISGEKNERMAMTKAEQSRFSEFINSSDLYAAYVPMFNFMLSTGVRVGEAIGLTWSNVDLKENVVHIRQQLIYNDFGNGYEFHIQDLKSKAGMRDIPLTEDARKSLLKQREISFMLGSEAARKEIDGVSDFVFINKEGKPHSPSAVNQELVRIVNHYNKDHEVKLPHLSAHILRHSFCSRMVEAGIDVKTLQYLMGHADVSITLNRYTHMDFSIIQENMKEIQKKIMVV